MTKQYTRTGFIVLATQLYTVQGVCDEYVDVVIDSDSVVAKQSVVPHTYLPLFEFNSIIGGLSINLDVTSISEFNNVRSPENGTRFTTDSGELKKKKSGSLEVFFEDDDSSIKAFIKKFWSVSYQKSLGHGDKQELGFNARLNGKFGIYFKDSSNGWKCEMNTKPRNLFGGVNIEGSLGCRLIFY